MPVPAERPDVPARHAGSRRSAIQLLNPRRRTRVSELRHARPDEASPQFRHVRADGGRPRWLRGRGSLVALTALATALSGLAVVSPLRDIVTDTPAASSSADGVGAGAASRPDATAPAPPAGMLPTAARPASAGDMRLSAEQVFGQHAVLTSRLARSLVRGDEDLALTADAALGRSAYDVGRLIAAVLGEDAARQLEPAWSRSAAALSACMNAAAKRDPSAMARSRAQYTEASTTLGALLSEFTGQQVPAAEVQAQLRGYADSLLESVRAYAAGDHARAYELGRADYARMFQLGGALGSAIAARDGSLPADAETPERRLQSRLSMLLGEHAQLAVDTMRSGLAGSGDFVASAAALDANGNDLASTVVGLFGAEAGQQLTTTLADQVDALAAYTQAVQQDDQAARDAARGRLAAASRSLADLMARWTEGRLALGSVASALAAHDVLLLRQIDAYDAREYQVSHDASVRSFHTAFAIAGTAGQAFDATVEARVPRGGAATGHGGSATTRERR